MGRITLLRRIASFGMTALMASFGLTGIASAQTITNTGAGSINRISTNVTNNCRSTNINSVSVSNSNTQSAFSGNANDSGNTTAGLPWTGWSALNPAAAQAAGTSYASWWSGMVNWLGQRASGTGWNSNQSNLGWTPSSSEWTGFDPVTWQTNGQSFGNWYNSVESYLNANTTSWVLGWPVDATGTSNFGSATSGNATNNYNANFSININNAARAEAGTNSCGQSNFTPPPETGGMGGGGSTWYAAPTTVSYAPHSSGGLGGYGGSSTYYSNGSALANQPAPVVTAVVPSTPALPSAPATPPVAPASSNTISNTGQDSYNSISSTVSNDSTVSNTNNVSMVDFNAQSASTGNASASANTTAGGTGSGSAVNVNGFNVDGSISN